MILSLSLSLSLSLFPDRLAPCVIQVDDISAQLWRLIHRPLHKQLLIYHLDYDLESREVNEHKTQRKDKSPPPLYQTQ